MDCIKYGAGFPGQSSKQSVDAGVKFGAAGLILAIEMLVLHGKFLSG